MKIEIKTITLTVVLYEKKHRTETECVSKRGTEEKNFDLPSVYNILVENLKGRNSLIEPRHGREDNIKINLRELCWEVADWIYLAPDND